MKKDLFLIVGPSGSGKTMLAKIAAKELGLRKGVIFTDRPRLYEKEKGPQFITPAEFDLLGESVTYTDTSGFRYAAPVDEINAADLFVVDAAGIEAFKNALGDTRRVNVIAVTASAGKCRERLAKRQYTGTDAERIMLRDRVEYDGLLADCDKIILNDYGVMSAAGRIEAHILRTMHAEDCNVARQAYEAYSTEWLMTHGITVPEIMRIISGWVSETYGEDLSEEVFAFFWAALERKSFYGESVPSFEEFLSGYYSDPDIRDQLFERMEKKYGMEPFGAYKRGGSERETDLACA